MHEQILLVSGRFQSRKPSFPPWFPDPLYQSIADFTAFMLPEIQVIERVLVQSKNLRSAMVMDSVVFLLGEVHNPCVWHASDEQFTPGTSWLRSA